MNHREIRVTIVEDSSYIAIHMKYILEKNGFKVVSTAKDGLQAVERTLRDKPDVVLMDLSLPHQNGLDAAKTILAAEPYIKIIVVSGIYGDEIIEKALQSGCFSFIKKPFNNRQLIETINLAIQPEKELKYG